MVSDDGTNSYFVGTPKDPMEPKSKSNMVNPMAFLGENSNRRSHNGHSQGGHNSSQC